MDLVILYLAFGVVASLTTAMFIDLHDQHKAEKRDQEIIKNIVKEGRY